MSISLKRFAALLREHHLPAYLVTHDPNIHYLTQFPASESWLLITNKKSFYITDFRYLEEAKSALKGITVKRYKKSMSLTVFELLRALGLRRVGFDDRHVSLAAFKDLRKHCPKRIKLTVKNNLIESLREVKSPSEINLIRKALKVHKEALDYIKHVLRPGLTEKQILLCLEEFVRKKGVEFSFPPIVASGANSAFPHAKVTNRKIKLNDIVLVDMGIDVHGYKSDLTRMFFLGKIPRLFGDVEAKVRLAQQKAIAKIKAGVLASQVDYEARNYLAKKKLAQYFGHSLGHGVGLEIHEAPRLSETSKAILRENMVVTVEPAVYIPHKFGIRIEDMVLVTRNGCEVLSADIH